MYVVYNMHVYTYTFASNAGGGEAGGGEAGGGEAGGGDAELSSYAGG